MPTPQHLITHLTAAMLIVTAIYLLSQCSHCTATPNTTTTLGAP